VILLGGGTNSEISVTADSNRAALGGSLTELSIAVRDSRSPFGLLEVSRFETEGSNLELGWTPLVVTAGIPLALFVGPVRRAVWTLSIYYYLWAVAKQLVKRGAVPSDSSSRSLGAKILSTEVVLGQWKRKVLGGSPSKLRFKMVLSNENLSNSSLLMQSSKALLSFLMKNSVLQTAAIVGDAVSDSTKATPQPGQAALPGTTTDFQAPLLSAAGNDPSRESPKKKLSKLLSATAFELVEAPTFWAGDGKNHLRFVSAAILPENQARLDFVLRTTLEAGRSVSVGGLRFVQPEVRFDVREATASLPLPKVVSDLLPKVLWLPIGNGVALGGGGESNTGRRSGGGLTIETVEVVEGGICELKGTLVVCPEPPKNGGLVRR
jgi:hypothetical protein